MSTEEEVYARLEELKAEQAKLGEENQAIHDSIKDKLDANREAVDRVSDERELLAGQLIEERGFTGFIEDIEFAKIAYQAMWNNGRGGLYAGLLYEEYVLSKMPYIMSNSWQPSGCDDFSTTVPYLEINIPRGAEVDKLDETAENLEKLHRVHRDIMKGAYRGDRIGILTDDLNYSAVPYVDWDEKDQDWTLSDGITTFGSLREVFDWLIANKWTYSATAEYEADNPNWTDELWRSSW